MGLPSGFFASLLSKHVADVLSSLVWGPFPEDEDSSQSNVEEAPRSYAAGFRMPRIASSNSSLHQTTNFTAPQPLIVSSQTATVSTREPVVVSSQSVNPLPQTASRGNGRSTVGYDGVGIRGTRRNSDERDEQMLSLEEFLAETSRATTRRIEMEEEDADRLGPSRSGRVATNAGSAEDLGVIGSGIPNTRARTTPRQWQTSPTTSSNSRRQLARHAGRLLPPPTMMRSNAESAAMANWNNFARQAGQGQGISTQIQTPLQLAVAGGPTGFFDVVRRIRDIGTLQDALLEPGIREPDLIHIEENEPRRTRLSEAQRSSRLRAFQLRLDLISSEFELLRANRIELSRLEQDAVNTLQSLSVRTQSTTSHPGSNLVTTTPSPTPALLQMSQIEQAARIRRDLERIDEETRNLRHAILPEHPLTLPTNNSPRIHSDIERLVPRSTSPPRIDFDGLDRTAQPSTTQFQRQVLNSWLSPHPSEVSDRQIDRRGESTVQLPTDTLDSMAPGASSENQAPEPDPVLSLREAWAQLDQPGLTEMEQLQLQVNIQRLISHRARRLLDQHTRDTDNGPRNAIDARLDASSRASPDANVNDSSQYRTRSNNTNTHEPVPPSTVTESLPTGETREIVRHLRRQSSHANPQREVLGSFYRQFQRA
ncbi:hypothetical protein FGG08_000048 [Glutinoglossum americanum]|uniref:Uncharacterized protein n=1 Tax=Glutinoglossum americanum TaxID=1670608 RepID=A0A9P8IAZ2_9PEZI|nr:hypothetical protein FGG08_000048 [Glutinoglossum americanum]